MPELGPEKRLLLAFALSFAVLGLWTSYSQKKQPPRPPASTTPLPAREGLREAPQPAPEKVQTPAQRPMPVPKLATQEREIVVETDIARIVFSSRGAIVKSWTLKQYKDAKGQPLDLVHPAAAAQRGYPLSFALADAAREEALDQALFVASTEEAELRAPAELVFEYSDGKLAATKRLRFPKGPVVELETHLLDHGTPLQHGLAWRGGFGDATLETAWADLNLVWREPNKVQRKPAQKMAESETFSGPLAYAGFEDRYFGAIFLPTTGAASAQPQLRLIAERLTWKPEGVEKPQPLAQLAVVWPAETTLRLFVGPKALDVLEQVQPAGSPRTLDELVDFGWFALIAKPIFLGMHWIYDHGIANYGWAIVLLTGVINMGLFPLKWKSMQSAWKMQKIAPQMRAIQEKYKKYRFNDPRKQPMQAELMALYREHGVNPLGGCFPLLLQIPFFYAFYTVLVVAIELRHAPWFGWVRDLSVRDPYYILPILMTVTMYISTKMTPMTTTDPAQQKMMTLMPLLFGVLFFTVSSGLVLYWLASNVMGIGQQYWMNRHQQARAAEEKRGKGKKKL
jgi:YidC/Oxa1 family membrane protein insertase